MSVARQHSALSELPEKWLLRACALGIASHRSLLALAVRGAGGKFLTRGVAWNTLLSSKLVRTASFGTQDRFLDVRHSIMTTNGRAKAVLITADSCSGAPQIDLGTIHARAAVHLQYCIAPVDNWATGGVQLVFRVHAVVS